MSDTSQPHITIRPPVTFAPAMGVRARGPYALARLPSGDDNEQWARAPVAVSITDTATFEGIRILPFVGRRPAKDGTA